jgi:cytidine deaminase
MLANDYIDHMLRIAKKVIKYSYSPYSKFPVSAVVRTASGKYYYGVNVENASYGLTVCAERVAVFKAVSEGERVITDVLVYAPTRKPVSPCGACRQVIAEFNPDARIIMANESEMVIKSLRELLPLTFTKEDLE